MLNQSLTYNSDTNLINVREYFDNGNLKIDYHIDIHARECGPYKSYYDNGQLWVEMNYLNGERHGTYKQYFETGQLWIEMNYFNGIRCGRFKSYYPSGQLAGSY